MKDDSTDNWADQYTSEAWTRTSEYTKERDGNRCAVCGATEGLQVHHSYYSSDRKIHEYNHEDLLTVCDGCHEHLHILKTEITRFTVPRLTDGYRHKDCFDYEDLCNVAYKMAVCKKSSRFGEIMMLAFEIYERETANV